VRLLIVQITSVLNIVKRKTSMLSFYITPF